MSVFVGPWAGGVEVLDAVHDAGTPSAEYVESGIYIGAHAGAASSHTTDVILIGTNSSADNGVVNAIGLGKDAHVTVSNSMNVPVLKRVGGGVLVVDDAGNVTSSSALADLLARVTALETA
jgi:hypothetical protein